MDYGLNSELGNRVFASQSVSRDALGKSFSYFANLIFCKNRSWMVFTPSVLAVLPKNTTEDTAGVEDIFAEGNDFKVTNPVVVFDPVNVVYDHIVGDGSAEKLVNEPVDFQRLNFRRSRANGNDIVSIFVYTAADNLPSFADYSA